MEDFLVNLVGQASSGVFAYGLVFLILLACGLGVPLPEDVSLILGGFLVHQGKADLTLMMLTGYVGIIVGDSIIFFAGRRLGSNVGRKPGGFFARVVTPEKRARVEALFQKHGEKIVFFARFLPGVRAVTYFTAGSVGLRYWKFALFDSIAALISAPVFIYLGNRFGGELETLFANLRKGQTRVLVGAAIAAVLYVGFRVWKARREKQKAAAEAAAVTVAPPQQPVP